jgi:hypothetical protein
MPLKKLKAKNHEKMNKNEKTQNLHSFLALVFFRGVCLSRHQRIWNQHKILRFFDTHSDIFQEKKFFLPISIILRVIPMKFETLKPPNAQDACASPPAMCIPPLPSLKGWLW